MLKSLIKKSQSHIHYIFWGLIIILFIVSLIYGFALAYKRYINFEQGKFDLGNMTQIVWNTSQGRFMELTDQFGTNMPRWGMSHFDPILIIFAPIFWFWSNPMILVFSQHLLILSAIIPIYLITIRFTKSRFAGLIIALTYVLYPAIGFTLVWTGFHGISFVAPLIIWLVWFLEKYLYLNGPDIKLWHKIVYWILIVLMLMGKEEIGAILAIYAIFLYFHNKELAIYTFLISFAWFLIAFFVIIPSGEHYRDESINTFLSNMNIESVNEGVISGGNFFLFRYSKLGSTYGEMIITLITRPIYVFTEVMTPEKISAINNLIGPLGYIIIFSPLWIISMPDLAIVLLSNDAIFDISNHRIAFVISALFLSYLFLLKFIYNRLKDKDYINWLIILISLFVLFSTIYFSDKTQNPIYISGTRLIQDKIISKVFADEDEDFNEIESIGDVRNSDLPRNNSKCLNTAVEIIKEENPSIYTGPDYLGAHSASREVNALFPSRYWDAELVVADVFDAKVLGPFGDKGWTFNKYGLQGLMEREKYHLFSCGQISVFKAGKLLDDIIEFDDFDQEKMYELTYREITTFLYPRLIPSEISIKGNDKQVELLIKKKSGDFSDNSGYWYLENKNNSDIHYSFIDYLLISDPDSIENRSDNKIVLEKYTLKLDKLKMPYGDYKIYYGLGDLNDAKKMYLGDIKIIE